jgi:hypothetical protein
MENVVLVLSNELSLRYVERLHSVHELNIYKIYLSKS